VFVVEFRDRVWNFGRVLGSGSVRSFVKFHVVYAFVLGVFVVELGIKFETSGMKLFGSS
ncbi:hypothetical protein MTR67_021639, partial [Solanum verrucosum]